MARTETTYAWWVAVLTAASLVYACAKDSSGVREPAASAPEQDASLREPAASSAGDAALGEEDAATAPTCAEPIPVGELQDKASGPSVFGQVVSGEYGWYDTFGNRTCGLEGARVCLFETETCTESDEAGQYVLEGLPEGEEVEISVEKAGYFSVLRLVNLLSVPVNLSRTRILRAEDRRAMLESLGLDADTERGGLAAVSITPGEAIGVVDVLAGVQITLSPGAIGPVYSLGVLEPGGLASDELDPDLAATREGGWAIFPDLEAGDYTAHFEAEDGVCSYVPGFGLGADEAGDIRVRVRDGFNTGPIAAFCP